MALTKRKRTDLEAAAEAIVRGEHGDPFAWLGMHELGLSEVAIRTFQPEAEQAFVIDRKSGRNAGEMSRIHANGLFSLDLPKRKRFGYRLRLLKHGGERVITDPYSFLPLLGEMDAHLIGEGNHLRIYEKLGVRQIIQATSASQDHELKSDRTVRNS
jgi:1,4-alpha-glucan branching enzyme